MERLGHSPVTGISAVNTIIVGIVLNMLVLIALNFVLNGTNRVGLDTIRFTSAEKVAVPQRFEAQDQLKNYKSQFRPRQKEDRRFHFKFEGEPLDKIPHTLWIPHSGAKTEVYINGARSGKSQAREFVLPGMGVESYFYDIPRFQVLPGLNRVDIYVASDPSRSGLGPIYFGPAKSINPRRVWSERISQTLPVIAYIAALLALVLNLIATLAPSGLLKFLGMSLASLSLVLLYQFSGGVPILTLAVGIIMFALVETKNREMDLLKSALIALGLCGPIMSILRIAGLFPFPDPNLVFICLWAGSLPILLGPAFTSCLKMVSERRSRVNELEEALDDTKGILEKEIRRRAIFEERERLTRDIHDGVGGQLLGLLLRLRTGDVARETITRDLQYGLNDLRLVVDALDHTGNDLGNALQAFRDRATNQLDAAGLSLKWTQVGRLTYEPQGQDAVINLYRILQEVISNIIRHANAKHVEVDVSTNLKEQTLTLKIQDDGVGRDVNAIPGRGTLNIKRRAEILEGTILTGKGLNNRGHSVMITLPLSRISAEA